MIKTGSKRRLFRGETKLEFSRSWFEDEVREGFYVDGMMKCAWAAQLEVIKIIDDICRKYDIRWFLDCGSLLGAVRHGGYIPWDDDFDICMMRDDYNKFIKAAPKELEEPAFLCSYKTRDDYWELLMRVVSGDTIDPRPAHMNQYHNFPYVVGVDIFPIDFIAPSKEEEDARIYLAKLAASLSEIEDLEKKNKSKDTLRQIRIVEQLCKYKFDKKRPMKLQAYELMETIFGLYNRGEADEVALMPYWAKEGSHKYKKSWFEDIVYLPFENMMLPAPACYDAILRTEYGDYMRIVHAGAVHDYPYYSKMEPTFAQFYDGVLPYNYTFSKDELCEPRKAKKPGIKSAAHDFMMLLRKAHSGIKKSMDFGDISSAISLLEQCQEGTIRTGTSIEEAAGEGFVTVKYCEEYCEAVYQLAEALQGNSSKSPESLYADLDEALDRMERSVEKDFHEKKEVVFLPFKPSAWKNMEYMWRKEKEDPYAEVKVVPIPYFYKNPDGTNSDSCYDLSAYPDYLNVINCNEYDFAKIHPDRIYIQNPYDQYNYITTVHPFFYSKNIKNYTDELVYIPYFAEDDPDPGDGKAKKMMDRYVTMPGVFHADRIILQSEAMKKAYIEKLCEFSGEETKDLWEKKIEADTEIYPKPEAGKVDADSLPQEWKKFLYKENGEKKKAVIYHTTVSSIVQYGEAAIDKMRKVFEIFEENKDKVALIWRPQSLEFSSVGKNHPGLLHSFEELVNEYKSKGYGIYDDNLREDAALGLSDAYYGDASPLSQKSRNLGHPVMIQDVNV